MRVASRAEIVATLLEFDNDVAAAARALAGMNLMASARALKRPKREGGAERKDGDSDSEGEGADLPHKTRPAEEEPAEEEAAEQEGGKEEEEDEAPAEMTLGDPLASNANMNERAAGADYRGAKMWVWIFHDPEAGKAPAWIPVKYIVDENAQPGAVQGHPTDESRWLVWRVAFGTESTAERPEYGELFLRFIFEREPEVEEFRLALKTFMEAVNEKKPAIQDFLERNRPLINMDAEVRGNMNPDLHAYSPWRIPFVPVPVHAITQMLQKLGALGTTMKGFSFDEDDMLTLRKLFSRQMLLDDPLQETLAQMYDNLSIRKRPRKDLGGDETVLEHFLVDLRALYDLQNKATQTTTGTGPEKANTNFTVPQSEYDFWKIMRAIKRRGGDRLLDALVVVPEASRAGAIQAAEDEGFVPVQSEEAKAQREVEGQEGAVVKDLTASELRDRKEIAEIQLESYIHSSSDEEGDTGVIVVSDSEKILRWDPEDYAAHGVPFDEDDDDPESESDSDSEVLIAPPRTLSDDDSDSDSEVLIAPPRTLLDDDSDYDSEDDSDYEDTASASGSSEDGDEPEARVGEDG
jgi:hypothetical protein